MSANIGLGKSLGYAAGIFVSTRINHQQFDNKSLSPVEGGLQAGLVYLTTQVANESLKALGYATFSISPWLYAIPVVLAIARNHIKKDEYGLELFKFKINGTIPKRFLLVKSQSLIDAAARITTVVSSLGLIYCGQLGLGIPCLAAAAVPPYSM